MSELDDPRVYFASERTLLAWLRTGIALMGLGYIIARAGALIDMGTTPNPPGGHAGMSLWLGIALVALGSLSCILSGIQFYRFVKTLKKGELPRNYKLDLAAIGAVAVGGIGILLALHLVTC